ncbi:hypothetical protein BJX99DRAFT_256495 [Aspergillus californicus]
MSHPNPRDIDAARFLVNMARIQGHNATADNHHRVYQETHVRPLEQSGVKRERNEHDDHQDLTHARRYRPTFPGNANPRLVLNNAAGQNLQSHLIRQQILAGIAPEDFVQMNQHPEAQPNARRTPALLQITNNGAIAPRLPPATFIPRIPYPPPFGENEDIPEARVFPGALNRGAGEVPGFNPFVTPPHIGASRVDFSGSVDPHGAHRYALEYPGTTFGWNPRSHACTAGLPTQVFRPPIAEDPSATGYLPGPDGTMIKYEHGYLPQNLVQHTRSYEQVPIKAETMDTIAPLHTLNIMHDLLEHPDIFLVITEELHAIDLINLQKTSQPLKAFVIEYLPKIIQLQVQRRLCLAAHIFPWRCYRNLWFTLPMPRNKPVPGVINPPPGAVVTFSPSFRWLQMVKYRDQTVNCILRALKDARCGFPRRYKGAILKLWFLMDIPDMKRREWTIKNLNLWTDLDLFMAILFVVRLDMFVKTKRGNNTGGQRRLMMAQPTLTFCHDVLTGSALRDDMELLAAFVRWRFDPPPGKFQREVFGVPPSEVGSLQYEYYGKKSPRTVKLSRPDEIILHEARRRKLNFKNMYRLVFIHAQTGRFSACERPNATWDQEVAAMLKETDGESTIPMGLALGG